jgi:hypothetical protein
LQSSEKTLDNFSKYEIKSEGVVEIYFATLSSLWIEYNAYERTSDMKRLKLNYVSGLFLIVSVNFLLHLNILNQDIQGLHSWRQSQTMWNIRNFVRHDGNILNPRVSAFNSDHDNLYRYEFPIMQWAIAMTQKVFGEKMAIVRILMFLISIGAITGIYALVRQIIHNEFSALTTTFLFQFSPIFYYYSFTPLPDILALSCGIWYLYFMLKFSLDHRLKYLIWGSVFLLIATLAKLPYLMLAILSIYFFVRAYIEKTSHPKQLVRVYSIQLLLLIPAFLWYTWVMPTWSGNPILLGIFGEKTAAFEFIKLLGFHGVKMFPNKILSFPIWIPFTVGCYYHIKNGFYTKWLYSLIGITIAYLILQLNTIGRDHDYYLLPFLPWLFILVALGIESIRLHYTKGKLMIGAICMLSLMYTIILTHSWSSLEKTSFNADVFHYAKELKSAVPSDARCIILNDHSNYIFSYQIDKMGYMFSNDFLPVSWMEDLIENHNVRYMYSDSELINNSEEIQQYIESEILAKGSVKVYSLKSASSD